MNNLAKLILTSDANFIQIVDIAQPVSHNDDISLTDTGKIEAFESLNGQAQGKDIMLSTESRDYSADMINNAVCVGETDSGSTIWKIDVAENTADHLRLVTLSFH